MGFFKLYSAYFIRLAIHLQIKTFTDNCLYGIPSVLTPIVFKD